MSKRDKSWNMTVHKILSAKNIDYSKLLEVAPLVHGRYKLHGFASPNKIRKLQASDLDLSKSRFSPICGFIFVTMRNCIFDSMKYEGNISGTFTDCSFQSANFSCSGFLSELSFSGCDFTGATFKTFDGQKATFHDCTFDNCTFKNSYFVDCVFNNCSFSNANFKASTFGGSDFIDLKHSLSWIVDPPGRRVIVRYPGASHVVDFNDTLFGLGKFLSGNKKLECENVS